MAFPSSCKNSIWDIQNTLTNGTSVLVHFWQGKYRKVLITRDAHFLYVPFYIHLNPLRYVMPQWREGGVRNVREALKHLAEYRWSSHLDYFGIKIFPQLHGETSCKNYWELVQLTEDNFRYYLGSNVGE